MLKRDRRTDTIRTELLGGVSNKQSVWPQHCIVKELSPKSHDGELGAAYRVKTAPRT